MSTLNAYWKLLKLDNLQPLQLHYLKLIAITFAIIFFHTLHIGDLPMGLYWDEAAIGLNAHSIAESGTDEHSQPWPIFFKSFGDNKNPIYIYTTALIFKLFGTNDVNLRLTSTFFFLTAYLLFVTFLNSAFFHRKTTIYWGALTFGFVPYFFTVSRISFEVISQLTWTVAIFLTVYKALQTHSQKHRYFWAIILALLIGTSIYTYTTSRLIALLTLFAFSCSIIQIKRIDQESHFFIALSSIKLLLMMLVIILITLIPYIKFGLENPGSLSGRFLGMSYLDDPYPWHQKAAFFIKNYANYWWSSFLVSKTDNNLRHAIGYGGAIYFCIWIPALIALFSWIKNKTYIENRFIRFLMLSWFMAPIGASLINDMHILRTLTFGLYWIVASCYGLGILIRCTNRIHRLTVKRIIFSVLFIEASIYLAAYFVIFPERSLHASELYNTKSTYESALNQKPEKIWFFSDPYASYANMKYRLITTGSYSEHPVEIVYNAKDILLEKNQCIIYYINKENSLPNRLPVKYSEKNKYEFSYLEQVMGMNWTKYHFARLKCY